MTLLPECFKDASIDENKCTCKEEKNVSRNGSVNSPQLQRRPGTGFGFLYVQGEVDFFQKGILNPQKIQWGALHIRVDPSHPNYN
jgi:hypothetical protein